MLSASILCDQRIWAETLGVPGGLDLAWVGDGQNYHTKRDTVENIRPGSIQHTGTTLLGLLAPLLRVAATAHTASANEQQNGSSIAAEVPFYQDILGMGVLIIPREASLPVLLLVLVLLVLSYSLQRRVLGVQTSPALIFLSCLTLGVSFIAAAAAACCWSVLGALLLQSYGPLYVAWPPAAAWRVAAASAAMTWCWNMTFFRKCAHPSLGLFEFLGSP